MEKIVYKLVYNRRKCLNRHGMALVQVEAYLQGRKKYFTTGVYLKPEQWEERSCCVKSHPNAAGLNRLLYERLSELEDLELNLWLQKKSVSLENLKEKMLHAENSHSFLAFYRQELSDAPLKETTKRNHRSTLLLLRRFRKEIGFADLTFEFVTSFEHFLQGKGYHVNTIAKHLKHLKRYVNIAINKELMGIEKYAFRKYKIKTVENRHTHLAPDELALLEGLVLQGRYRKLQKTLDAFLFCCYAGMRYSDFVSLRPENVVVIHARHWLVYKSVKTNTEVHLPIYLLFEGKALHILKRYEERPEELFKLKNNSNVNKELSLIARLAGLEKHISFHTARHTHATLLIYNGVNITTVQKLLGHKSVKTTQIYTNIMDRTIVYDLERNCGAGKQTVVKK